MTHHMTHAQVHCMHVHIITSTHSHKEASITMLHHSLSQDTTSQILPCQLVRNSSTISSKDPRQWYDTRNYQLEKITAGDCATHTQCWCSHIFQQQISTSLLTCSLLETSLAAVPLSTTSQLFAQSKSQHDTMWSSSPSQALLTQMPSHASNKRLKMQKADREVVWQIKFEDIHNNTWYLILLCSLSIEGLKLPSTAISTFELD